MARKLTKRVLSKNDCYKEEFNSWKNSNFKGIKERARKMSQAVKLEVKGITKTFPGVKALDNVSFSVKKGTVHVLCGENGAGKSTLMKIINGIYKPDSGEIVIDGKPVNVKNPIDARKHGISMIFQELNYIPEMTIEESFFVGSWPVDSIKKVDWKSIKRKLMIC